MSATFESLLSGLGGGAVIASLALGRVARDRGQQPVVRVAAEERRGELLGRHEEPRVFHAERIEDALLEELIVG